MMQCFDIKMKYSMTRRVIAFIFVFAAVILLSACAKPAETAQTQEEFQSEY